MKTGSAARPASRMDHINLWLPLMLKSWGLAGGGAGVKLFSILWEIAADVGLKETVLDVSDAGKSQNCSHMILHGCQTHVKTTLLCEIIDVLTWTEM